MQRVVVPARFQVGEALPDGIAGVDNLAHFLGAKQRPQGVEPIPLVRENGQPPALRDDAQILIAPLLQTLVVHPGVGKGHQMPDAPGHDIAAALQAALLPVGLSDHGGDAPGYAGFFCDY